MSNATDGMLRHAKRVVIAVVGGTLLLLGIAGLVLPIVPGWVLIGVGLGVLAIEFAWAQHLLKKVRDKASGSRLNPQNWGQSEAQMQARRDQSAAPDRERNII